MGEEAISEETRHETKMIKREEDARKIFTAVKIQIARLKNCELIHELYGIKAIFTLSPGFKMREIFVAVRCHLPPGVFMGADFQKNEISCLHKIVFSTGVKYDGEEYELNLIFTSDDGLRFTRLLASIEFILSD